MKYLKQLMIILVTYFAGQVLQTLLHLPVPGSVIGLVLLFLALRKGIIKVEMIEDVCEFLLSNMSFFFIPAGVGLITSFAALKGNWFGFITILITSTAVVWIITASVIQLFRKGNSHE
ncbi:LrgA family protein [Clostridium sp. MSTE9]|uniref:CidA/LrgA family protein n=1 Tax=Clostridium sp. (strain MSTE9) TaxID=1105031 RepID=UPI00026F4418|nr:CidA/LrgA family protein [Clostridium sp. MSTE9]EJF39882.1 LrgA family protein [Clostridium sp. MSTE9]